MQNSQFIKSRKTFEGTTKNGQQRKVTIFLSQDEAKRLAEAAQGAGNSQDGACLTIFIGPSKFNPNEVNSSVTLEAATPSAKYQAGSAPRAPIGGASLGSPSPVKFAFKPKAKV